MTVLFDAPTFLYKFQFVGLLGKTGMHIYNYRGRIPNRITPRFCWAQGRGDWRYFRILRMSVPSPRVKVTVLPSWVSW